MAAEDNFDLDGEESCPRCGTRLATVPDLQLRYTTCCGYCLCMDCVNVAFRSAGRSMNCPQCEHELQQKSFVSHPYLRQKFDSETRQRSKLNHVFHVLGREDFESDQAYNDHLEFVEDIMFSLVYGEPDEVSDAEARLAEYKARYAEKIAMLISRKVAQQSLKQDAIAAARPSAVASSTAAASGLAPTAESIPAAAAATAAGVPEAAATAPAPPPEFQGPKVLSQPQVEKTPDLSVLSAKERRLFKYQRWVRSKMQKQAGGFREQYAIDREIGDAQDSLFVFPHRTATAAAHPKQMLDS